MKTQIKENKILKNKLVWTIACLSLILVWSVLSISFVSASVPVDYNVRYGIIEDDLSLTTTTTSVSGVYTNGYTCANSGCTTIGSSVTSLTGYDAIGAVNVIFPTQLQSQHGYLIYFHKLGYIGWEQSSVKVSGNSNTPITAPGYMYLSRKRNGFSPIVSLQAQNHINPGEAITINLTTGIDTSTSSAITRTAVSNVPLEENVETRVTVEIFNDEGTSIHSETRLVNIEYSQIMDNAFEYVFNNPGAYVIKVYTDVTDAKIINSIRQTAEINVQVGNTPAVPPVVNIISPVESQIYNTTNVVLDTTSNQVIDTWTYVLNSGAVTSFTPGNIILALEGCNTLVVSGTNVNGVGTDSVLFCVNTTSGDNNQTDPNNQTTELEINVINPLDGATYNTTDLDLNVWSNQPAVWQYVLNNVPVNFVPNTSITALEGWNTLIVFASNNNGSLNETINFYVDLSGNQTDPNNQTNQTAPNINVQNPISQSNYTDTSFELLVSSDQVIDTWTYNLNNQGNTSFTSGDTIEAQDGWNTLVVYGTNVNGTGMDVVSFYVDDGSNEDDDDDDDKDGEVGNAVRLRPSLPLVGRVGNQTAQRLGSVTDKSGFDWVKCWIYILVIAIVILLIAIVIFLYMRN
jgi:hypothetical protein